LRVHALACVYLKVVVVNAGCAGPGNEIVVDDIMAKHTSSVGDSIGGLVVIHYIVDILRVGLRERLAVVPARPEIAVVGSLVTFNMCTELLANREGNNGVGNCDVGNTDAIDGVPLPKCNRAMVENNTVQPSVSTSLTATYPLTSWHRPC
jgi:hypothetical protein